MKKQNFLLTIFLILFSVLVLLEVMFNQGNASNDKLDPAKSGVFTGQEQTGNLEGPAKQMSSESEIKSRISQTISLGKLPLYFIANRGQVDSQARYYAKASRYTLWLTPEGLVFDSLRAEDKAKEPVPDHGGPLPGQQPLERHHRPPQTHHHSPIATHPAADTKFQRDVSRLLFLGANPKPVMQAIDEQELKVNYFKGNDPAKWQGNVPTFKAVLYQDLYPHIDLKVYGIEREVEYDWIIRPGSDPGQIRFAYKNVKSTRIDAEGNLVIETAFGEIRHQKPASYQEEASFNSHVGAQHAVPGDQSYRKEPGLEKRIPIDAKFQQTGPDTFGFTIEKYDKTRPLIIDPLIILYSTYLGGGGEDFGSCVAVDSSENIYVTGFTCSDDFPNHNQYQENQGGCDVFITRLDTKSTGTPMLLYSTFLGGENRDEGRGIAVDNRGNVYVTGYTASRNFPTLHQYQGFQGGGDVFVTRLDTNLASSSGLIYSTYLGGKYYEYGRIIAVDNDRNVYVTGYTASDDFPTRNPYQGEYGGGYYDAFVTRLDTNLNGDFSLIYSTYLGGSSLDRAVSISSDSRKNAYVAGITESINFPTLSPCQRHYGGGESDAFITRLDTNLSGISSFRYSTYIGGNKYDYINSIVVDDSENVYVTGDTDSSDFPIFHAYQEDFGGMCTDAFVTRVDTNRSGIESLMYSTFLGGIDDDYGSGIAVDDRENVYVTGNTWGNDFPTLNPYQEHFGGGWCDVFVTRLDTNLTAEESLIYSTYLGGEDVDKGEGIVLDRNGNVYVTGFTWSTNFPTMNPYQEHQGGEDVFVTKFSFMTKPTVITTSIYAITGSTASGGGNVTSGGNARVIARGVCWSTTPRPDLSDTHTIDGAGTGIFSSSITGLVPNTTYYARAYAKNSVGVGYGEVIQFKTLDKPRIMGRVIGQGQGLADVLLVSSDNSSQARTDRQGYYNLVVDHGWSGTVTPVKEHYQFIPVFRTYPAVLSGQTNQDFEAILSLMVTLRAERKTESAFIIRRDYGLLTLTVGSGNQVPGIRYVIERKIPSGAYQMIKELTDPDLANGTYVYYDKFLNKDKSYTYRVLAFDPAGNTLSLSSEATI